MPLVSIGLHYSGGINPEVANILYLSPCSKARLGPPGAPSARPGPPGVLHGTAAGRHPEGGASAGRRSRCALLHDGLDDREVNEGCRHGIVWVLQVWWSLHRTVQGNVNDYFMKPCSNSPFRDSYLGRIAAGRVASGTLRVGDKIRVLQKQLKVTASPTSDDPLPSPVETKVTKVFKRIGMERVAVDEAVAGDIVAVAGSDAGITDTLAGPGIDEALDPGHIDPPTLR